MDPIVTLDFVIAARPCHRYQTERGNPSRAKIRRAGGNGDAMSLSAILRRAKIPAVDRIWLALRPGLLDDVTRTAWLRDMVSRACDRAESALTRRHEPDARSLAAVEAARRYLRGEATREDMAWARNDAAAAAALGVDAYAYAAAYAAYAAYAYADGDAGGATAYADDDEREWQCARLANLLVAAEEA